MEHWLCKAKISTDGGPIKKRNYIYHFYDTSFDYTEVPHCSNNPWQRNEGKIILLTMHLAELKEKNLRANTLIISFDMDTSIMKDR